MQNDPLFQASIEMIQCDEPSSLVSHSEERNIQPGIEQDHIGGRNDGTPYVFRNLSEVTRLARWNIEMIIFETVHFQPRNNPDIFQLP